MVVLGPCEVGDGWFLNLYGELSLRWLPDLVRHDGSGGPSKCYGGVNFSLRQQMLGVLGAWAWKLGWVLSAAREHQINLKFAGSDRSCFFSSYPKRDCEDWFVPATPAPNNPFPSLTKL